MAADQQRVHRDEDETGPARGRRAPAPHARLRDAERSRERLLAAALAEFAEKGYAGARVGDIAARAGVNKQLISYYFGGKEGLAQALRQRWLEVERGFADQHLPLDALIGAYARATLAEPRLARLLLWIGLESAADAEGVATGGFRAEDVADLERRREAGELAAELDAGMVGLALLGAILAPIAFPQTVRTALECDPASPEFAERYAEQLRRIVRRLAE